MFQLHVSTWGEGWGIFFRKNINFIVRQKAELFTWVQPSNEKARNSIFETENSVSSYLFYFPRASSLMSHSFRCLKFCTGFVLCLTNKLFWSKAKFLWIPIMSTHTLIKLGHLWHSLSDCMDHFLLSCTKIQRCWPRFTTCDLTKPK